MSKQFYTFAAKRPGGETAVGNTSEILQQEFGKLNEGLGKTRKQQVPGIRYIFGCVGHTRFLINLTGKLGMAAFETVVKDELGGYVDVSAMPTENRGEKFLCGQISNTTISREATLCFGKTVGEAVLLRADGDYQLYSFDPDATPKLTLMDKREEAEGSSESEDSTVVTVGCELKAGESAAAAPGDSQTAHNMDAKPAVDANASPPMGTDDTFNGAMAWWTRQLPSNSPMLEEAAWEKGRPFIPCSRLDTIAGGQLATTLRSDDAAPIGEDSNKHSLGKRLQRTPDISNTPLVGFWSSPQVGGQESKPAKRSRSSSFDQSMETERNDSFWNDILDPVQGGIGGAAVDGSSAEDSCGPVDLPNAYGGGNAAQPLKNYKRSSFDEFMEYMNKNL